VVDAVDDNAAAFYERYGFVRAPEHPLRLYGRMKDVRDSLDSSADGQASSPRRHRALRAVRPPWRLSAHAAAW